MVSVREPAASTTTGKLMVDLRPIVTLVSRVGDPSPTVVDAGSAPLADDGSPDGAGHTSDFAATDRWEVAR